jgi:Ca2+-binding RTX toxin-like protein
MGNDIVISYAGTNPNSLLDPDNAANIGLATGFGSTQLLQAAEYYLQIKAANPMANITFTGHSLGGGLAALIGVFFGKQAVTFDQAPFANSAELSLLHPDVAANLKADLLARGYSEADLLGLTNFLQLRETNGGIPNSDLVRTIRVDGEFTSSLPIGIYDPIGTSATVLQHGPYVSPSIDMHSQSLLTAFLQSVQSAASGNNPQQTLSEVTKKLTDLLGMMFNGGLFQHPTNDPNNENFLEHLVRHEAGIGTTLPADQMVKRFTDDLWKLAQDGGLTMSEGTTIFGNLNNVSKTLIAFAMQMYYEDTANATNASKELFTKVTGGVQFDRADVAATLDQTKGYNLYFQNYLNSTAFSDTERQLIQSLLPPLRDWYVQAGPSGMNVADGQNRGAFMLGGNGADSLTGGTQADLLVGNAGADTLNGRGSNDVLLGGAGFDTYIYNSGDGTDRIEDAQGQNAIIFDHQLLHGGIRPAGGGAYTSLDGRYTYALSGTDLIVNGVLALNENFQNGQFGIRLVEEASYGQITRTEFTKQVPDPNNPGETIPVPFFDDQANHSNDLALPLTDEDNNFIHAFGGNDTVISGAGDDQLYGDSGSDTLYGGLGNDRLFGGTEDDVLVGDNSAISASGGSDYLDGGEGNDLLQGGAGADIILGGTGDDNLNGDEPSGGENSGANDDYLDGGDGDDELHGAAGRDVLVGGIGNDLLIGDTTPAQGGTPEAGGADTLDGGIGDDQLFGLYGDDVLAGGIGNDLVNGQDGNDVLYGGDGTDTLSGDLRINDVGLYDTSEFRGAGGDDLLYGDAGIDALYGGEGADLLVGGAEDDTLYGDYNFNLFPVGEAPAFFAIGGNDMLDGGDGNDSLDGGVGDDALYGGAGTDSLHGGEGADCLYGGEGNDTLDGGAGDDEIHGGVGNDRLVNGLGLDTLYGEEGDDRLEGGNENFFSGTSVLYGGAGNDAYVVDSQSDVVVETADSGTDTIESFVSNVLPDHVENLTLQLGNLTATGNSLDNVLRAPSGYINSGRLDGQGGNDTLIDGSTYVFGQGYGHDTVIDFDLTGPTVDRVEMAREVLPSSVTLDRSGDDLLLHLNGSEDLLTMQSYFDRVFYQPNPFSQGSYVTPHEIEEIRFADGTVWTADLIKSQFPIIGSEGNETLQGYANDNIIQGRGGDDILYGLAGNDSLDGGTGNDTLYGGEGDDVLDGGEGIDDLYGDQGGDTYLFGRGSELEVVHESGATTDIDKIQVASDFLPTDVSVTRSDQDLVFTINGTSDQLRSQYFFLDPAYQIEELHFANGTIWDQAIFLYRARHMSGTQDGDSLLGYDWDDVISGLGGDDLLFGGAGADVLDGGEGNDSIFGGEGADILVGGVGEDTLYGEAGNDTLRGGAGHDTYFFNPGDGVETIEDVASPGGGNRILFGYPISQSDLTVTQNGSTLTVGIGNNGDAIHLVNFDPTGSNGSLVVETLEFADGSIVGLASLLVPKPTEGDDVLTFGTGDDAIDALGGNDVVDAGAGNDTITGGTGNDTLTGGVGNDSYVFNLGDGVDTIDDTALAGEGNMIQFGPGITPADLSLGVGSLLLRVGSGGDAIHLTTFDPANAYGPHTIETFRFADGTTLTYSQLIDRGFDLTGMAGNDTITGTNVVDRITGLAGDDTIQSGAGDDVLDGGAGADTMVGGIGNDTYLADDVGDVVTELVNEGTDTVRSSVSYGLDENVENLILTGAAALNGTGNGGNNVLTGNSAANALDGGAGDDMLLGGNGNDTMLGGTGNDRLEGGTGSDAMTGGAGNDTYVVDVASDTLTEVANEGTDTVESSITYTLGPNVENLTLTGSANINGTGNALDNSLIGNIGNNSLAGGAGNDRLDGGTGIDAMAGGTGDDIYVVDTVADTVSESSNQGTDTVQSSITYALGSNVENLRLLGTANIKGTGNSLSNALTGNSGNNQLEGGSGNDTVDGGDGNDSLLGGSGNDMLLGGLGNDTLTAGSGNDILAGGEGTDMLDGGSGDDQLLGGTGTDSLSGGSGADQFTGGTGNDQLTGGSGNDLYNFSRGDGQDTIIDQDPFSGNQDKALFGAGINPIDLIISQQANDLRVSIYGTTDQLTIQDWYTSTNNQIETVQAGDGQQLLNTKVDQLIQAMATFGAQTGLTWEQAIAQRPQDVQNILAASWQ